MRSNTSVLILGTSSHLVFAKPVNDCSCGYWDAASNQLYTEAVIVYFNESDILPDHDFFAENFVHKREKGWNSVYRQGAVEDNVSITNSSDVAGTRVLRSFEHLELFANPPTKHHLVQGASVRSRRQDLLHGTFRTSMRSPGSGVGGSALSMILWHNHSSSIEMDLLNTDSIKTAAVTQLLNSEDPHLTWPQRIDYSILEKGSPSVPPISPWNFMDLKLDWTKDHVAFSIFENRTRIVDKRSSIPTEPLHLVFKHWSAGDSDWMQGPPIVRSRATISWVRAFFNSSLTTTLQQRLFDSRCHAARSCSVDDFTLRESTPYPVEALLPWKEPPRSATWKLPSAIVSGSGAFVGLMMLLNVLMRKVPWTKLFSLRRDRPQSTCDKTSTMDLNTAEEQLGFRSACFSTITLNSTWGSTFVRTPETRDSSTTTSTAMTPHGSYTPALAGNSFHESGPFFDFQLLQSKMNENSISHTDFASSGLTPRRRTSITSDGWKSDIHTLVSTTPDSKMVKSSSRIGVGRSKVSLFSPDHVLQDSRSHQSNTDEIEIIPRNTPVHDGFEESGYEMRSKHQLLRFSESIVGLGVSMNEKSEVAVPSAQEVVTELTQDMPVFTSAHNPPPSRRIDHLAGLVSVTCLAITFIHFTLTFIPFVGGLPADMHYKSEKLTRWIVSPVVLNPIWVGPMFVVSCRFLAGRYLMNGNLSDLAQKMLLRAPRILVPCALAAMLEYFFIEEGLTGKLQWLPSVSWSTWPEVKNYPNFGWFLNEILELAYLVPNKAPAIVAHYCIGVLWTVPVQLQFSYTSLLAAVMAREIKTPWKRITFYVFCIVNNWYALSWGSCFWLGVMLADLQLTYKYDSWVRQRPAVKYPLLVFLWCVVAIGPLFTLLEDRLHFAIMTYERGWHPDSETGLPTSQTPRAGYPAYYEPRLNTLLFAGGLQVITECSSTIQAFLCWKPWIWIFPHSFTIYLIHGFVFWSLGAWLVVTLAESSLPYWSIMVMTFLCCYAVIGVAAIFMTPALEGTAQAACHNLWRWAAEEPVPKQGTLSPFPKDLFLAKAKSSPVTDVEACSTSSEGIAQRAMDKTVVVDKVGTASPGRVLLLPLPSIDGDEADRQCFVL